MYTITCYENTGFNPVNIPDSPTLLESMTVALTQQVDVLQDRWLPSVRVKTTYDAIKNCDYCKIGDTFYSVDSVQMVAVDTAILNLTIDAITTAGGASGLTYLDGITERHTVSDDAMFLYTQPDEYCAPMEQLDIKSEYINFGSSSDSTWTAIETTVDIAQLISQFNDDGTFTGEGLPFQVKTTAGTEVSDSVTVPYVQGVSHDDRTTYNLVSPDASGGLDILESASSADTQVWVSSTEKVEKALGVIRSLGIESGIINQVSFPSNFVPIPSSSDAALKTISGYDQTRLSSIDFASASTMGCHNNRVAYGECNKFGLMTASGANGEYLPEQIGESTDVAPTVRAISDPRLDGKPYFRFQKYMGDESLEGFWLSCVSGLQWASAPLVWQGQSGSYQNREQFKNDTAISYFDLQAQNTTARNEYAQSQAAGAGRTLESMARRADMGDIGGGAAAMVSGLVDASLNEYNYNVNTSIRNQKYRLALDKELQNYAFNANINAPTVAFPFSANAFRDFIGNGVIVYKYSYKQADAERVDQLLTMYGYKDTVRLTGSLFNNRQYFDYVRAVGVSIGGDIAYDLKATIASQLNAGVRVWHVKPDASYYSSGNPIRS